MKPMHRQSKPLIPVLLTGLLLVLPVPALSELDPRLSQFGWQEFTFDDREENSFQLVTGNDALDSHHIQITSDSSVSIAYYTISDQQGAAFSLENTPYLSFEWQRQGPAINTDLSRKGGDDRILSVYAAFAYQPEHASFSEKLTRKLVELKQGKDAPGRLLTYLWGGGPRTGSWFENPYTGDAGYMKILLRPTAPADIWHRHQVNLYQDFIDRFGHPPSELLYIAIASDTDDTNSRQTAFIRGLNFTSSPAP